MGDNFNDAASKDPDGNAVHIVDPENPQSLSLLAKAYRDVYKQVIPPNEREPMEDWIDSLRGGNEFCDMAISLLGENLNSKTPIIKGLSVGYYYRDQDAGLLAYNVMAPEYDMPMLQQAMMDATTEGLQELSRKNGGKMDPVFLEADDPARMSPSDDRDNALERLKMYDSFGAKLVNIVYIQPPLSEGAQKNETLRLLTYPGKSDTYPSKDQVKDFLTGIYTGLAECAGMAPKDNPDYQTSIRQTDAATQLLSSPSNATPAPRPKVLRFNL